MKKLLLFTVTAVAAIGMMMVSASACSMIYVGSEYTDDGATYFARSEDISNSYNKVFYVSEAGKYKADDVHTGCYGFTWTHTHDSYAYTAFRDDNLDGVCPDEGEDCLSPDQSKHTPFEEAGTNSEGVSVTATVTLGCNSAMRTADPMIATGMDETDLATIILSEAATAREGVELLCNIYATQGASSRSGVIIADQNEAWYIENYSGTQYIAIKLPDDMIFLSPNMGTIGLVDLDDENIIASDKLIETAQAAGTFVGNAEENQIDIRASYSNTSINARMVNGLNYLNEACSYTAETITDDVFKISNVADDGTMTDFHTDIEADRTITIQDLVDFYKVDGIGNTSNLEYHVFQIRPTGKEETATVEWVGMDHGAYGVTIPYYPMLLNNTYAGYQVGGMARTTFVTELPEDATGYYPATSYIRDEAGNRVPVEGYKVLPTGWENSYYWCFDAVSNYALSDDCSPEMEELILANYASLQDTIYETFAEMEAEIPALAESDLAGAKKAATEAGSKMAETAHKMARCLYFYARNDGPTDLGFVFVDCTPALDGMPLEFIYDVTNGYIYYGGGRIYVPQQLFRDVAGAFWYADGICFVVENGIMNGTGEYTFSPSLDMTRGMLATVLYRMAGSPDVTDMTAPFTDVEADSYYQDAVIWAYNAKIVNGMSETTFVPEEDVSREQIAAMLYRYATVMGYDTEATDDLSAFVDAAQVHDYAKTAMQWAVGSGMIQGMKKTEDGSVLSPRTSATRGQIATMLMRFLQD